MYYHIRGLFPIREMGGAGFHIQLWPEWKTLVAEAGLTQENCDTAIDNMGRVWLDGCGLYEPRTSIRVSWGKWGTEHIDVPGNACGLDIDDRAFGRPVGGAVLLPHNVDSVQQAHLLLVVFCWFANTIILQHQCKEIEAKRPARKRI